MGTSEIPIVDSATTSPIENTMPKDSEISMPSISW